MNTDKLSMRLETVAKYVPAGARIADIGSDHAYLPCFLAKNTGISFAVAGEVAAGPYHSAERNVQSEGLSSIISVRMGNGLEVIQPGEVDYITIAGMGGSLITSILENGKEKLGSVKRLILQPNISAVSIRKWFMENNWELIAEEIMEEDGKIYEVLVGEKGDPSKPYQDQLESGLLLGPFLCQKQESAFQKKWTMEIRNWKRIVEQLESAGETAETLEKKQELLNKIKLVEEVLKYEES
ncbi:tRNA (adenine22-N1)-methyltransferase [Bacillus sp. SORGH_AS 510]|uniref:tRNA (adenine(22)-N(1))-methyltransferase n=1 Tax=Bacillus sp. SORGH_AS_0510 TaxID=3041771 RepID=UPI0027849A6E|nr:tRNA (adenine(22)-N(1))-methyltransferase TrmK [Bacillus sp. SORGH_AS_0510]MDQ1145013.1 tRNA (adenine22-N1)-methyltransferase [Bacillus sp. SORGH_AS_0510]